MEINNSQNIILQNSHVNFEKENNMRLSQPSFKAKMTAPLDVSGKIMSWIESGGFLVSFLIQDFLGMTVPRTYAGFLRDKEVTGKYNKQEGFEVLGREGMTGPCMMAVAPISLYLSAKWASTTSVNTELIKRFGNSLKEIVAANDFDRSILNNKTKFKEEFYRTNIENILNNTLGKENVPKEAVDHILSEFNKYENIPEDAKLAKFRGKSKYRAERLAEITNYINEIKYKSSSDLDLLQKVKFGTEKNNDIKAFDAKRTFEAMKKYANDTITTNGKLDKLNEKLAESLKHNALGKRIIVNIGMIAATLGVLSVLPKIYARSNTAPGARKNLQNNSEQQNENKNISFKGKDGIIEKIGKKIDKNKSGFISRHFEYNGHNFTDSLMACLSLFGLLTPRCLRAYNRAEVDEKGKRDFTELYEILFRDVTSSLAVVFAVPMMTRAFVTSYEKNSGFVLMQKDRTKDKWKTTLDLFNPYSKAHVLTNSEITALYGNIDSKEKMINFCKYIDKNGGDLTKILANTDNINEIFNENTTKFEKLKSMEKGKANKEVLSFMENIESNLKKLGLSDDKKSVNEFIGKLMKNAGKAGGKNKVMSIARGLNSVPGLLATVFISPYILGWVIPRWTYSNTRRIHANEDKKRAAENESKIKVSA